MAIVVQFPGLDAEFLSNCISNVLEYQKQMDKSFLASILGDNIQSPTCHIPCGLLNIVNDVHNEHDFEYTSCLSEDQSNLIFN